MIQFLIRLYLLATVCSLALGASANEQSSTGAKTGFFEQRYRGWLWFDEREKEAEEQAILEQREDRIRMPTIEEMKQAKRENEQFSEELELLRHLVIRNPQNLEYIKLYKLKEREMLDNAQLLGSSWLMVNFLNPDIVDELENPQNIYGRDLKGMEDKRSEQLKLRQLAGMVEIFVFRQDGCPYCKTLEKHLKTFATKHGFKVEAVSPDNSKSEYFETHSSLKLIEALGLEVMPTVIAVVNDTRQRFELARGAVSVVGLERNALLLSNYLEQQAMNSNETRPEEGRHANN